jgi:hypothetical protein
VLTLDKYPGFKLEIAKDSVTFPDGSNEGLLSVTQVNANKVPMPPPNGMQPQFIVTIQPTNTQFDPPARLTLPNTDGFPPGEQVEMYSYDHDLEEFVSIGLGTVSNDATLVTSNPGVGVIKAGWHCGSQPGGQGCAHNCPTCQNCDADCNCVPISSDPKAQEQDVEGDCKSPQCSGGSVIEVNNDADVPSEKCKTCSEGNIEDIPEHVTDIAELTNSQKCPDGGVDDDSILHEIDGCTSSPDDLESWDNLPFAINYDLYVTNPIWGTVLGVNLSNTVAAAQTLPCNVHDICYQTCGNTKSDCDVDLIIGVNNSCDIGYPFPCPLVDQSDCQEYTDEYNSCRTISATVALGLSTETSVEAYQERQTQHCFCCNPN